MNISMPGFSMSSVNPSREVQVGSRRPVDVLNGFDSTERTFGGSVDTSSHSAVIKMMMNAFGQNPTDMFSEVRAAGEGYDITLKDGYKLHLPRQELERAAAASRFAGGDGGAIENANFALAVFVKRKQLTSMDVSINRDFDTALSASLQGETPFNVLKGMGMTRFMRRVPSEQLLGKDAVGVMETHHFGAALIRDGVGHRFGRKHPADRSHVYVLANDQKTVDPSPAVVPQPQSEAGLPVMKGGQKPADILNGFNAVGRGFGESFDLSSHAAVIKMMMMRFGQRVTDVFEKVTPVGDGYDIRMKDGFEVHLSRQELTQVGEVSRFNGSDRVLIQEADFMLAAYAKRKQLSSADPALGQHFDAALSSTLRGDTPYNVLKGMGMIGFLRIVPPGKMQEKGAVAVAQTYNFSSTFVLDGVQHSYGNKQPVVKEYGYMLADDVPAAPPVGSSGANRPVSDVPIGIKPANIWSGFYQGVEGNCVTVSAIKATMMKYGQHPLGIYKSITETREGYTVTMRDSCTVSVTHAELKKAEEGSHFKGDDNAMLKDATFLYAVSAKRAQLENHEFRAAASFEAAMGTLNDGESPGDALRRLGLYAFTRASTVQELAEGATGTLANFRHSVVVVGGVFDDYGFKRQLKTSEWMRNDGQALKLV